MNFRASLILMAVVVAFSFVKAQNIPPPAHPNSPYYVPPGAQSGNYSSHNQDSSKEWQTRWGSIATDKKNGIFGSSVNMPSKNSAKREAILDCKKKGGVSCEFEIAYANQCVAMSTGNIWYNAQSAETPEDAAKKTLEVCEDKDTNCRVFYQDCSLAKQVR